MRPRAAREEREGGRRMADGVGRGNRLKGRAPSRDGRSLPPAPPDLLELIEISRAVGADPDLVQGGGGNTSVKSRDGKRIYIKASGTALGDMDPGRGWVELDLEAVRALLSKAGRAGRSAGERE